MNNDLQESSTKVNKYTASDYSLFIHCLFHSNKNKHDFYRGENTMKKFCADLRKIATEIINCKKKERNVTSDKETRAEIQKQTLCYICKQALNEIFIEDENYYRVQDHCHFTGKFRGVPHSICYQRYKTQRSSCGFS